MTTARVGRWKRRPLEQLNPLFQNLFNTALFEPHAMECCAARGVARSMDDFRAGKLPPPIPVSHEDLS